MNEVEPRLLVVERNRRFHSELATALREKGVNFLLEETAEEGLIDLEVDEFTGLITCDQNGLWQSIAYPALQRDLHVAIFTDDPDTIWSAEETHGFAVFRKSDFPQNLPRILEVVAPGFVSVE